VLRAKVPDLDVVSQALDAFRAKAHQIGGLQGARAEQSLYGPFGELLHAVASALTHPVTAVQQVGTLHLVPDYGVFRDGHIVNWVELKSPDKDLDHLRGHDLRQIERAKRSLEAFVLTNGWDWRYFEAGRLVREVQLPAATLRDPVRSQTSSRSHDWRRCWTWRLAERLCRLAPSTKRSA
jgi:hypothetical protein